MVARELADQLGTGIPLPAERRPRRGPAGRGLPRRSERTGSRATSSSAPTGSARWNGSRGIDFHKTRFSLRNGVNTSRRFSLFYGIDWGEQIRFVENPFLGRLLDYNVGLTPPATSRLNAQFSLDAARFNDMHTGEAVFDVKILRTFTTYQFTDACSPETSWSTTPATERSASISC